jgi:hypothetical protein
MEHTGTRDAKGLVVLIHWACGMTLASSGGASGSSCCALGNGCTRDTDCASNLCTGGVCD